MQFKKFLNHFNALSREDNYETTGNRVSRVNSPENPFRYFSEYFSEPLSNVKSFDLSRNFPAGLKITLTVQRSRKIKRRIVFEKLRDTCKCNTRKSCVNVKQRFVIPFPDDETRSDKSRRIVLFAEFRPFPRRTAGYLRLPLYNAAHALS